MATTSVSYGGLPRSMVWRLRLGLLQHPAPTGAAAAGDHPTSLRLDRIITHNLSLLQNQQEQYESCQRTYSEHLAVRDVHVHDVESEEEEAADAAEDSVGIGNDSLQDSNNKTNANASDAGSGTNAADPAVCVDPLTAMLMEQEAQEDRRQALDLRYRKERARRKRGLANAGNQSNKGEDASQSESQPKRVDRDTLNIIDKDLLRLPCPNGSLQPAAEVRGNEENGTTQTTTSSWDSAERQQSWIESLREVLYIYSQEQSHVGYRQGMHEVASYIWLALEMDQKENNNNNSSSSSNALAAPQQELLFGKASAYHLLRCILNEIRQAYDVKVASNSKPLEDMSRSILSKIKQQHVVRGEPDQLTPLLESLSVPPQLYCTKWIRLLFSREVVGCSNVLTLWDAFIELVSEGWELMAVLESAAASRILLCQDNLLHVGSSFSNTTTQSAYHHRVMDLLMNMPPLETVDPLLQQLKHLLTLPKYQPELHPQQHSHHQYNMTTPLNSTMNNNNNNNPKMYPNVQNPMYLSSENGILLQQQQNPQRHPSYHKTNGALGDETAFSLRAVKERLEQGVERLSSSSDTWRKRLVQEWTSLKQQQEQHQILQQANMMQGQTARAYGDYHMDASLFADDDDDEDNQNFVPISPRPVPPNSSMDRTELSTQASPYDNTDVAQPQLQAHLAPPPNDFYRTGLAAQAPMYTNVWPLSSNQQQQRQAPQAELAHRLGNSVSVLQEFVMNVARDQNTNPMDMMMTMMNNDTSVRGSRIPTAVWEALADVEAVRNALLQQTQQQQQR